jgi:parallel beta-helix repeat protein
MIDGAPDCGIYVNSVTLNNQKGCVISGNTIRNCNASAIAAKRICSKSIISSNNIEDCTYGITMESASTPTDFSTDIAITNNWIYNVTSAAIGVQGGFNHVISGNTAILCDRGILVDECSEVTITGNIVETNDTTPALPNLSSCIWVTYRTATPVCKNVVISSNTLKTHGGRAAIVFGNAVSVEWNSITITGNAIDLDTHAVILDVRGGSYLVNSIISNNTFISTVKMRMGLASANNDVIISNNQGDYYALTPATTTALRLAPYVGAIYTGNIAQRIVNLPATTSALTGSTFKKGALVFTGNKTGVVLYLAPADGVGTGVLTALINV